MKNNKPILMVLAAATMSVSALPVYADAISPRIMDKGTTYSKEPANSAYYGTGIGGRAMEAMTLRFEVERLLQEASFEEAIFKAKKACQLDPATPDNHVLLARALTRKFYSKEGPVDEKLLNECLAEWRLIWFHDADQWEQAEAKSQALKMGRIAKMLAKRRLNEEKERLAARQLVAESQAAEEKKKTTTGTQDTKDTKDPQPGKDETKASLAERKKRFLLF